ncbi:FAD-dependent oxidoreductase [Conexibacter sp. W3-3-2]|uniref:L-aspartate oxidase n=1 Tax=Conexibacter sp. W3-3-2 TaxID=2675227 RepID=UPI0013270B87|nr:FAD-binding protein [Conexibacter sp. W3-3-2]MTD44589.1 FAD-dependent oxidoreductase [Conexibacter sp. W3-3-2]
MRQHRTGVLVIGAGAAGLRTAIACADAGVQVLVVGKRARTDAHTVLAAGGINAALGTMDPQDDDAQHAADTLHEGYWLGHPEIVQQLVEHSPRAVDELAGWGARFHREDDGRLSQRFFGAHRWRRTCFAGDYTGREIQHALVRAAKARAVDWVDGLYVSRLLVGPDGVFGAVAFDLEDGERHVIYADQVVLAAGGHTRAWRRSSSRRDENCGDAFRLAALAGARLQDMELVQFHPTGMVDPEYASGTLVTEAVRGEGGILRNVEGERYMERYDPVRKELSTRDRVALANYTEILEGRGTPGGGVLLDVTHLDPALVRERLPRMYRQFLDLSMLDITRQPMEVAPTAHYSMGGVLVDPATHETDVPGLWCCGEAAAGLHGANRLGGNSLAECVVFGRLVGEHAAQRALEGAGPARDRGETTAALEELDDALAVRGNEFARPLQRAVRDLLWERCGVVRDEAGLDAGLRELDGIEEAAADVQVSPDLAGYDDLAHLLDLRALILSARSTMALARERRESRGAHQRADHPDTDPGQQHNLTWTLDGTVDVRAIPEADAVVREKAGDLDVAGRLLE